MSDEENKEEQKNEEGEEEKKEENEVSYIDQLEAKQKELMTTEERIDKKIKTLRNEAESLAMAGKSKANPEPAPHVETPKEYAEKVMSGKIQKK